MCFASNKERIIVMATFKFRAVATQTLTASCDYQVEAATRDEAREKLQDATDEVQDDLAARVFPDIKSDDYYGNAVIPLDPEQVTDGEYWIDDLNDAGDVVGPIRTEVNAAVKDDLLACVSDARDALDSGDLDTVRMNLAALMDMLS
jgi:hypothetical protein